MKFFPIVLALIFVGITGLYIWVGKIGGGEQLQQDKAFQAELQGREFLQQKRPEQALPLFDKGLKALEKLPQSPQRASLLAGKGDALKALGRCPEARQAWAEACKRGQPKACQPICP